MIIQKFRTINAQTIQNIHTFEALLSIQQEGGMRGRCVKVFETRENCPKNIVINLLHCFIPN